MEYHEAANFLFDLRRFQVDPGTESVRDLLEHLEDPHDEVTFVQVAGSNGKGSVARMTESILREAGYRVGLFTSPHLDDLRERVRVDGRKIPESEVATFVEKVKPWLVERAADGEPLTFFEVITALGLWRFGRAGVDVAVLEVGMGGRLDATSVVDPAAAAVTNVALEHTAILGDTIAEIARTKAHIAPQEQPLVTSARGNALETIRDTTGDILTVARRSRPDPSTADVIATYEGRINHQESQVALAGDGWSVDVQLPLLGGYQSTNAGVAAALARQVADELDDDLDDRAMVRGLRSAHWPGRFEVMETTPLTVLDGAHNPDACESVTETLAEFEFDRLHLVFGAMHDKDHLAMARALPTAASVRTCAPTIDRAEDAEVLARVFERTHPDSEIIAGSSVVDALQSARSQATESDCVLLTGSLFCVAAARPEWTGRLVPKSVQGLPEAERVLVGSNATAQTVQGTRTDLVHRTVKTRVSAEHATVLETEFPKAGGTCATTGVEDGGELHEVVLSGTVAEFRRLIRRLDEQEGGLLTLARRLRHLLGGKEARSSETPTRPWDDGTAVMGILNITPDSFHDGGEYYDVSDAVAGAERLKEMGVDILDIGGESTRPGADPVPPQEEIERVVPVIEAISDTLGDELISVDTRKAEVAEAALDAGADILNDVTGLEDPEMRFLAADRNVPVVIMHSIDAPVVPEKDVEYDDVVEDVIDELTERVLLAEKAGISRDNVIVDPGLGFGKTGPESFELLGRLEEFGALGCPVLIGHSHKSMFETVGGEAGDALHETVAATALAAANGADIVRVHDAAPNVQAVRVAEAVRRVQAAGHPAEPRNQRAESGPGGWSLGE